MRNVTKQAEQARAIITPSRELMAGEIQQLYGKVKEGGVINSNNLFNALTEAFYFGFNVGHRQGLDEKRRTKRNGTDKES